MYLQDFPARGAKQRKLDGLALALLPEKDHVRNAFSKEPESL